MKKLSIIIVTYNSIDLIKDCIDSIFTYNDIDEKMIEVFVVDNSPFEASNNLHQYLLDLYDEKIFFINNKENLGYGHGNNIGIKKSSGEIICIMNPDIRLTEPIFLETIKEFERKTNLAILGYKQIGGKNISYYLKPELFLPILNTIIVKLTNKFNVFLQKYFYLSGALLFIDKNKFIEIGLFDENIFLYFEEPDISNRFLTKGYSAIFKSNKNYNHLVGDRSILSESVILTWLPSVNYYFEKHKFNKFRFLKKSIFEYMVKILVARLMHNSDMVKNYKMRINLIKDFSTKSMFLETSYYHDHLNDCL